MKALTSSLALCAALISSGANATLESRLGGLAVYDTDLNITWLANANLAATNSFGVSEIGQANYISPGGYMTWNQAQSWIGGMNGASYLGFNNWRLPDGEMGHLFYNELSGVAGNSITAVHDSDYNLFQNFQSYDYWSGMEYSQSGNFYGGTSSAYYFSFGIGQLGASYKGSAKYVLAVRPGDMAAVPVPSAAWLLGSGLLVFISVVRHKAA